MVWDDELHVPIAIEMGPADAFGEAAGSYRRPLILLSYTVQAWLGLASARDLHAANALLHGANAALVVTVLGRLGGTAPLAFAAALLFAFHPLASGSVAYISGRTDLLATLFTLLAVRLSLGGPRPGQSPETRAASGWGLAVLAAAAVAAAGLSKESGLAAGPLVAAVLWWQRADGDRSVTAARILLAPAVSAVLAFLIVPEAATAAVSSSLRLRAVGTALATYAGLLVWPSGLHLDRLTPTGSGAAAMLGVLAVVAAAAALASFARRPSRSGLLAVALVLFYAPGSGMMPVYPAIADRLVFTGEQFLYAPMIAIAVFVVAAVERVVTRHGGGAPHGSDAAGGQASRRSLVVVSVAGILALAWTPVVISRQAGFASAEQVYRTTLEHSPSPRACFNLGGVFLAARDYGEAIAVYERCIAMTPGDAGAYGQLAVALQQTGRAGDARVAYERSTTLDSRNALVWSNFATLDANAGHLEAARTKWERALAIDPHEKTARAALEKLNAVPR